MIPLDKPNPVIINGRSRHTFLNKFDYPCHRNNIYRRSTINNDFQRKERLTVITEYFIEK